MNIQSPLSKNPLGETIHLTIDDIVLEGKMYLPKSPQGIILCVCGGVSHTGPLANAVLKTFYNNDFGVLVFGLLTDEENLIYGNHFDTELLTQRLLAATNWVISTLKKKKIPMGYFAVYTGAAAAIKASFAFDQKISTIVSYDGRLDLVNDLLKFVKIPTLILVDTNNKEMIKIGRDAYKEFGDEVQRNLLTISGASLLSESSENMNTILEPALIWFKKEFKKKPTSNIGTSRVLISKSAIAED